MTENETKERGEKSFNHAITKVKWKAKIHELLNCDAMAGVLLCSKDPLKIVRQVVDRNWSILTTQFHLSLEIMKVFVGE